MTGEPTDLSTGDHAPGPRADQASEPTTSAAALTAVLDGRWHEVRERVRGFELQRFSPRSYDLETEQHRARVLDRLRHFAESGLPQRSFPTAVGGIDDVGGGMIAIEMLGYRDLSLMVKAGVQWGLFAGTVCNLGTEAHHNTYLPRALSTDLLGCFAMTESGHGSDVQSLETTATYDAETETFVIHSPTATARKDYIGSAARDASLAIVFAQLETLGASHGVHAFLVPIRDDAGQTMPGVTISDCGRKAGLNGVDNGRLSFDHVRVPRAALLDRYGHVAADGTYSSPIASQGRRFFTMLGTLIHGRITVGGAAQNATKHALTIACRYGSVRRQFPRGKGEAEVVLLDYSAHQRRLLPAVATSYALSFAQNELISTLHDLSADRDRSTQQKSHQQRELESRAAGLKVLATRHATDTIQTCREACGGAGYLAENSLPQLKADTDVFTTFEGDNTVLLQLVGKGLLTDYSAQFDDLDVLGTARLVTEQFVGFAMERTVARSVFERLSRRRNRAGDVRDRVWQLSLVEGREKHLVETLAARLRRRMTSGGDPFNTFNEVQPHLLDVARAHIDRVVLEAFCAAIDDCEDPASQVLLEQVCDLYVLAQIEVNRAWYLEHDRLSSRRAKEVTSAVTELCAELRPHVGTLVDGFGIPDLWVDAAILSPLDVP